MTIGYFDSTSVVNTVHSAIETPVQVLPQIILAIIVFCIGWIIALIVQRLVQSLFQAIPFVDRSLRDVGLEEITQRAGLRVEVGKFFGVILKVVIIIVAFVAALDILEFDNLNNYLINDLLGYAPNVITASIIVILGLLLANFLGKLVSGVTSAARIGSGGVASSITRWAVIVFTVLAAISELGVASNIIDSLIVGAIAATSLALGLAFGLGGQQAASDFIAKIKEGMRR